VFATDRADRGRRFAWHDPDRVRSLLGPMAHAVIGGLFVAALLTLLFLPALYVAWFRIKEPRNITVTQRREGDEREIEGIVVGLECAEPNEEPSPQSYLCQMAEQ